mgnify:CR=1 FL=1
MKLIINNKEFDSGKLIRNKYKKYSEIRDELINKEKYTDEDLEKMVLVLVAIFDNQFTEDDINNEFEVSDIIYNFMRIDVEIMQKLDKKIEETNKILLAEKK